MLGSITGSFREVLLPDILVAYLVTCKACIFPS